MDRIHFALDATRLQTVARSRRDIIGGTLVERVTGGDVAEHLRAFDLSMAPLVKSQDVHNARIGSMLCGFSQVCHASLSIAG